MVAQRRRRREGFAEKRERLGAIEDPNVVLEAALRFLEVRARSIDEVRRRLRTAGYRTELIEGAIERLLGLGILDDAAFAKAWVESRDRARPRGERALRRELQIKGIERGTVDTAMDERRPEPGSADDPDQAAAEALMARHASALARVADPRKRRQRAYAMLARNGFDPEIAARLSSSTVGDGSANASDEPTS
ncbi:MAG: regulatory protein RecX [Chloroflexota bacterium]